MGTNESGTACDNHAFHRTNLERYAEEAHRIVIVKIMGMPDRV